MRSWPSSAPKRCTTLIGNQRTDSATSWIGATGLRSRGWILLVIAFLASGCRQDMHDQPKIEPYEENAFFADGVGSRAIPAGTVARGFLRDDRHLWEGVDAGGNAVDTLPSELPIDRELLLRGKNRFEIYCSVCHDSAGSGRGMIVRRGFKQPPPLYEDRLIEQPLGYFFDVITNGFGVMSGYQNQIPVEDRWAITAYIRALQLSQAASLASLPADLQTEFHQALAASAEEARPEDHHGNDHH